jgi:hypothetical protein
VLNTNDSGPGSLRQAILDANANPGYDAIDFQVGSGVTVIQPRSSLPSITDPVLIDGTTQPGFHGTPLVVLDGTLAGTSNAFGLVIIPGGSTVRGLVVDNFHSVGIFLEGSGADLVTGNYIGTDVTGTQYRGNTVGIEVGTQNLPGNVISGNLISGNSTGAFLNVTDDNHVVGNLIGTNAAGTQPVSNGVGIHSSGIGDRPNVIGGTTPADRNIISGNTFYGVDLDALDDRVLGNYIGTDITGTAALGNGEGIYATGQGTYTVGGTAPGAGNVISGNGEGLFLYDGDALVEGNCIGLNTAGTAMLGNGRGAHILGGATIGGTVAGAGNVISGNRGDGILIDTNALALVQGNFIGTDPAGTAAFPNGGNGISVVQSNAETIGGSGPRAGNVISGNALDGIVLNSDHSVVQGNTIGVNAARTAALPNRNGLVLTGMRDTIGGTNALARNVIAGNRSDGIVLNSGSVSNVVRGNVLAANGGNGLTIAAGATSNLVTGNAIGTPPGGRVAYPNGGAGISIAPSAPPRPAARPIPTASTA